jgi:CubicO group peptidase (beta-lactamase class C family)
MNGAIVPRGLLVLAVLVFGLVGPTHSLARGEDGRGFPAASPESQGIPAAALRRLAAEVDRYVKAGAIVGGELLVIKNRKTVLHEAFGYRDREKKLPMVRDTIFNVRSMTKPITGVAVQMLAEEGKVRLDDPVARYLPGFDNDKSRAITLRQLLEHRSGLPLTILKWLREYPNLQAQAAAVGTRGPQFKPGTRFWYSDAGSDAAAAVVEHVTGVTIDRFVTERILRPLGMADSFYPSKADDPRKRRIASLYTGTVGKWERFWEPGGAPMYPFAWGSQTLYSTPADYARFLALWLDGGKVGGRQLLSKAAVARVLTPSSPMTMLGAEGRYPTGFAGLSIWYGQMSMLYVTGEVPAHAKVVTFGHGGSDGTTALAFPGEDLIVCYFTQSRGQYTTIRLETAIQDNLLRRGGQAATVPDDRKPYLGTYAANFGQFKNAAFQVLFRNGRLALDIPDQLVYELKDPDKDGRWHFVIDDKIAVSFRKGAAGKVTSLTLYQGGMAFELPRKTTP